MIKKKTLPRLSGLILAEFIWFLEECRLGLAFGNLQFSIGNILGRLEVFFSFFYWGSVCK